VAGAADDGDIRGGWADERFGDNAARQLLGAIFPPSKGAAFASPGGSLIGGSRAVCSGRTATAAACLPEPDVLDLSDAAGGADEGADNTHVTVHGLPAGDV